MKARKPLQIVSFKLEQRKDKKTGIVKTENVPIIIDFKFEGHRAKYPIGYRIDFDKWNHETQRVKNNNFNKDKITAGTINKRIERISEHLPKIYDEAVKLDKVITIKYLWSELTKKIQSLENITDTPSSVKKKPTVPDYIQLFIDSESKTKSWTEGTKKKFNTIKSHLEDYSKKHGCKLHFNDITGDFLQDYIEYLRTDKKLNNNTNLKYLKLFKWFMNWASKPKENNGKKPYNTNLSYKDFEYKFKGTATSDLQKNIVFLSWSELQHFITMSSSKDTFGSQPRIFFAFVASPINRSTSVGR